MLIKWLNASIVVVLLFSGTSCAYLSDVHFNNQTNAQKAKKAHELFEKIDFEETITTGRTNSKVLNENFQNTLKQLSDLTTKWQLSSIIGDKGGWNLLEKDFAEFSKNYPDLEKYKTFGDLQNEELPKHLKHLVDLKDQESDLILKTTIRDLEFNRNDRRGQIGIFKNAVKRFNRKYPTGPILETDEINMVFVQDSEEFKQVIKKIEDEKINESSKKRKKRKFMNLVDLAKEIRRYNGLIQIGEKLKISFFDEANQESGEKLIQKINDLEKSIRGQKKKVSDLLVPYKMAKQNLATAENLIADAEKRTDSEIALNYKRDLEKKVSEKQKAVTEAEQKLKEIENDPEKKIELTDTLTQAKSAFTKATEHRDALKKKTDNEIAKEILGKVEKKIQTAGNKVKSAKKELKEAKEANASSPSDENQKKAETKDKLVKETEKELHLAQAELLGVVTISNKEVAERYLLSFMKYERKQYVSKLGELVEKAQDVPLVGDEIKSEALADLIARYRLLSEGQEENVLPGTQMSETKDESIALAKEVLGILGRDPEVAYRLGLQTQKVPSINALILELAIHRLRYQQAKTDLDFDKAKLKLLKEKLRTYGRELTAWLNVEQALSELDDEERNLLKMGKVKFHQPEEFDLISLDEWFPTAKYSNKESVIQALIAYGTAQNYGEDRRDQLELELTALNTKARFESSEIALLTWKDYIEAPLNEIKIYHEGGLTYEDIMRTLNAIGIGVIAGGVY